MGLASKEATGDGLDWSDAMFKDAEVEIEEARRPPTPPPMVLQGRQQRQPEGSTTTTTAAAAAAVAAGLVRCPRCDSCNTKFCYYNNYSRSQPRHFCKSCRRHWTKGGTLRNVPVGGCRKSKRPRTSDAGLWNRPTKKQPPPVVSDHLQLRQPLLASGPSPDYFAAAGLECSNGRNLLLGSLPPLPPMPPPPPALPAMADPFYPPSSYSFLPFLLHRPEDPNAGLATSISMVDLAGGDGLLQGTGLLPTCGFAGPSSSGGYGGELAGVVKPPAKTGSGLPDLGLF